MTLMLDAALDGDTLQALTSELETISAGRRSVLFAEGDTGDYLYIVLSGKVKLTRRSSDGREVLIALLGPPDQFGELALLDRSPRTETATVVADAILARLDKTGLDGWIARRPQIADQLLLAAARRIRRSRSVVSDLRFIDVAGRVAKQLMRLADQFGTVAGGETRIVHDLTQAELAQLVGASRETVNKVLANYASRGWIRVENKCVVILDPARLARRATRERRR